MTGKNIKQRGVTACCIVAAITAFSSCDYKSLEEYSHELSTLKLDFEWARVDSVPQAMRVAFYPADDDTRSNFTLGYTFFDLPKTIWPASIKLPPGIYHVTAWNNDTEHIITDKYGSQATLFATTQDYTVRGTFDIPSVLDSIYNGQRVLDYPDYMVHANEIDYDIQYASEQELLLRPDSMVITIDFLIRGIGGLSWVKQIRGSINNVAGKRFMAYPNRSEESVAMMFDCRYNAADSLVYGSFYVFDVEPTNLNNLIHKMVFFFWMDGGKVYLPIDITEHIANYRHEQKKIIIDIPSLGIDLRDYISSKNTFDIELDEWEDININIGF